MRERSKPTPPHSVLDGVIGVGEGSVGQHDTRQQQCTEQRPDQVVYGTLETPVR